MSLMDRLRPAAPVEPSAADLTGPRCAACNLPTTALEAVRLPVFGATLICTEPRACRARSEAAGLHHYPRRTA